MRQQLEQLEQQHKLLPLRRLGRQRLGNRPCSVDGVPAQTRHHAPRRHGRTRRRRAPVGSPGRWIRRPWRRLASVRFPRRRQRRKTASRVQGLRRELPRTPKRRGTPAPDDPEVRHVRAPARLPAAQSEPLRQRPSVPRHIRSNAKFQSASRACQNLLAPAGAPGANRSVNADAGCSRSSENRLRLTPFH